ncbi:AMP-binding protein [Actinomadura alba]|uniref:AMP-binding protein n=1 Tax=Actinomadura alba TaxID=406431 RepID=UPI001C9CAADF|nr:AMP-binding protein [Actinomadura alba]
MRNSHPNPKTVPFAGELAKHADRTAVITADGTLSYRELAARVAATAQRLGSERRLVLLAGSNTVDTLVVYLAALAAGHPLLLVPHDRPEAVRSLVAAYDPDIVVHPDGVLDERRAVSAHMLHSDLALLLSTSGSTGSPKLIRLSHENLRANAASIADYLGIRDSDRAATTLPMHYCYGLSIINSHLLCGAALILTDLSVADARFWDLFRDARGSTLAGVPYTFDLLDRVGFEEMRLPHLRYVTQAGGRLPADRVERYSALGRRRGWDLFVMYGQTEATARMAYLPPDLAASHPQAIGIPIPGGSFRLEPLPDWPDPDTGELVYSGPNVMLGYAESPPDLALGRTVEELSTGDVARLGPEGLYEVVGRRSGFIKLYGLRIDPHRIETMLARDGLISCCTSDDEGLVVAVTGDVDAGHIKRLVAAECGLPARVVRVHVLAELPRLPTGKPDYQAVRRLTGPEPVSTTDLCRLYAQILDRPDVTEDSSFVSLGGDSLSYVEMSLRLEKTLGSLPADWHTRRIRDLRRPVRRARWRTLETSLALRAVAIVLIVGSHITIFTIRGGAHVLLAVAGFNFARFHLTSADRRDRRRHVLSGLARIAVPSVAWIALAALVTDDHHLGNALLLESALGHNSNYWFVEVIVYILIAMAAWLSVPVLDRAERRSPFGFALGVLLLGLAARFDLFGLFDLPSAISALWMFPLGWASAKASTSGQRLLVTATALATVPGYFGSGELARETIVIAGLILLIWVPALPSTGSFNRLAGPLAAGSLYIYLVHWQIYPLLADHSQLLALLVSLACGVAYAAITTSVMRYAASRSFLRRRHDPDGPGDARRPRNPPNAETGHERSPTMPVEKGGGG